MTEEIKKIHQPEEVQQVMDLLHSYGKTIAIGLALCCVAVLASVYYGNRIRETKAQASTLYMNAQSANDLNTVITDYPSSASAPLALFRLAGMNFSDMKYNEAMQSYESFLEKYPEHELAKAAVMGQNHCLEALGKIDEAMQGFTAFEKNNPEHFLTQESILGKARCMEQKGLLQDAKAVYEQFLSDYPESQNVTRANQRLDVVTHAIETGQSLAMPINKPALNMDAFPIAAPIDAGNTSTMGQ